MRCYDVGGVMLPGEHLLECGANERVQTIWVAVVSLVIMLGISGDYFRAAAGQKGALIGLQEV